jgi:hypothetical protein
MRLERSHFVPARLQAVRVSVPQTASYGIITSSQRYSFPCCRLVPEAGLEPAHPHGRGILSPVRLPIPPLGHARVPIAREMAIAKNYWRRFGYLAPWPYFARFAFVARFGTRSSERSLRTFTADHVLDMRGVVSFRHWYGSSSRSDRYQRLP